MLAIVCGIGAFALAELDQLSTINDYFDTDIVPSLTVSGRLIDDRSKIRVGELKFLNATNSVAAKEAQASIADARARLAADLASLALSSDSAEERRLVSELKMLASTFFETDTKIGTLVHARQTAAANAVFMDELTSISGRMNALLSRYQSINVAEASEAAEQAKISGSRARYVIWTALLFSLAASLAVFWVLVRVILRPIRAMSQAMTALANGKLDTKVPGEGRGDEIGRLAQAMTSFKSMAVTLQENQRTLRKPAQGRNPNSWPI